MSISKTQIRENLRIATLENEGQLPEGAVIERLFPDTGWSQTPSVGIPMTYIYRLVLLKPTPHPTLLSIVEHGCFPQDWAGWFAVDLDGEVFVHQNDPIDSSVSWVKRGGMADLVFKLRTGQLNWAQQCWTLQELRDIIKQNAVELSEAEQWCRAIYHRNQHGFFPTDFHECHGIGERIEMQRSAEQRKEQNS